MLTPDVGHDAPTEPTFPKPLTSPKAGVRSPRNLAFGLEGIGQVAKSPFLHRDRSNRHLHPLVGVRQQHLIAQLPANH